MNKFQAGLYMMMVGIDIRTWAIASAISFACQTCCKYSSFPVQRCRMNTLGNCRVNVILISDIEQNVLSKPSSLRYVLIQFNHVIILVPYIDLSATVIECVTSLHWRHRRHGGASPGSARPPEGDSLSTKRGPINLASIQRLR